MFTGPRGGARIVVVLGLAVTLTSLVPLMGKHPLDLAVYRLGGHAVLHGNALYSPRIGPYGFTYPPFAALLAVPFAAVPFAVASMALAAGSLASLVIFVRHSCAELIVAVRTQPTARGVLALLGLVCSAPVRGTFWNGQVNLLLAALVIADLRGRRLRGVGVGLAAAIKLTPAIFVLYLLACGRRREAATACAAFATVSGLAALVLPADSARFWCHQLRAGATGSTGIGDEARASNQSIHGLVLRLIHDGPASAVWLPLAVVAAAFGLRIAVRLSNEGREVFAIGVVGVTGCVVSPVSWVHHWVWAVPWLAGLAGAVRTRAAAVGVVVVAVVVVGWDRLPFPHWPLIGFVARDDLVLCAMISGLTALTTAQTVRMRGPSAVMATLCSKWAPRLPSVLRRVQPSSSTR